MNACNFTAILLIALCYVSLLAAQWGYGNTYGYNGYGNYGGYGGYPGYGMGYGRGYGMGGPMAGAMQGAFQGAQQGAQIGAMLGGAAAALVQLIGPCYRPIQMSLPSQNIPTITYRPIILFSPSQILIAETIAYITLVLLLVSYAMLCWVCLKKSPRSMNDYKWYILINATNGVIFETLLTLAHPELFLPYPLIVIGGIGRNLTALHPAFKYVFGDLFMLSFISIFYFTVVLFLFRYSQTVDNWLYRRIFSKSRVGLPLNAFVLLIFLCVFIIPQNAGLIARDSAIESMRDVDVVVYERIRNRIVLGSVPTGSNASQTISTVLIVLFLVIFLAVIVFSIYGCYSSLRRMRPVLSKRTASLYLALINSLVLDMAMAGFLTFVPVIVVIIALQSNSPYTSIIATIGLQIGSIYPLAANIILIAYVTPYRRATISLFWRILGREVSSVDFMSKFTSSAEQTQAQLFRSRATPLFTLGTRAQ